MSVLYKDTQFLSTLGGFTKRVNHYYLATNVRASLQQIQALKTSFFEYFLVFNKCQDLSSFMTGKEILEYLIKLLEDWFQEK